MRIAFGTDAGIYPHGDNAKQFAYMVSYGMTPLDAIRAATIDAARCLGRSQETRLHRAGQVRRHDRGHGRPARERRACCGKISGVIKAGRLVTRG